MAHASRYRAHHKKPYRRDLTDGMVFLHLIQIPRNSSVKRPQVLIAIIGVMMVEFAGVAIHKNPIIYAVF